MVLIAYNITLATGDATVDTELLCDTNAWVTLDWVGNATAHYVSGMVLFGLFYLRGLVKYNIRKPFTVLLAAVSAVILGCTHTFYSPIYPCANIWPMCVSAVVTVLILHFVLLWMNIFLGDSSENQEEEANPEIEVISVSTKEVNVQDDSSTSSLEDISLDDEEPV